MSLQDPEFDKFKRAYQRGKFDEARWSLEILLMAYPKSFALHWHHAKVLEKLEQFSEARNSVEKVLKLRSDFVPALVLQVQLDFHENTIEDDEDADYENNPALKEQARFDLIEQRLFKILSIDPQSVDALHMLSGLLRGHEGDAHLTKANQLLNRAINLAPDRIDLLEDRGNSFLASAALDPSNNNLHKNNAANNIVTFSGAHYQRDKLELALADFQQCYLLSQQHRYGLRVGSILHDLGRFNEALVVYDQVLAHVPEDDPYRSLIIERRARSENNGAGEREHMAKMLEATVTTNTKDRSLEENNVAQLILSAASAVRGGKSVSDALDERISDNNHENIVTSLAAQILNLIDEPRPDLMPVDPQDFPDYQQKFNEKCKHDLAALGLKHVCDAEAKGMEPILGQSVLLSFFADEAGEIGICCYCTKPKQISAFQRWVLLFSGKWKLLSRASKINKMVECTSQFANGDYLNTQHQSMSPLEYGPPIYIEKLPATLSPTKLVKRHQERLAEYKLQFPDARSMCTFDLNDMEERWIQSQALKRTYRKQIGFITDAELHGLLGTYYDKYAQKVKAKILRLAANI